jgi:enamine deaminase RidA (YjgF/YER057c/UK114 family)
MTPAPLRQRQATVAGGTVYLAGQFAANRPGRPIEAQAEDALARLDRALADAGSDRARLLRVVVYLADIANDFAGFNRVWNAWVDPARPPARACVQAGLAAPEYRVVIVAVAAVR